MIAIYVEIFARLLESSSFIWQNGRKLRSPFCSLNVLTGNKFVDIYLSSRCSNLSVLFGTSMTTLCNTSIITTSTSTTSIYDITDNHSKVKFYQFRNIVKYIKKVLIFNVKIYARLHLFPQPE